MITKAEELIGVPASESQSAMRAIRYDLLERRVKRLLTRRSRNPLCVQ